MAKRKSRAKAKPVEKKEPSLVGKKLTMKLTLGTPKRCFLAGQRIEVGKEIPADTARGWLRSGHAELIGDLPAPSEIK
jgi:hypothetical protein